MNDYSTESARPVLNQSAWHLSPREEVPQAQTVEREAQWKEFDNSVNAVSFGFVATAILISMFLVMAIFERFLRPRSSSFASARHRGERSKDLDSVQSRAQMRLLDKLDHSPNVMLDTFGPELQVFNKSEKTISLKADAIVTLTPNKDIEATIEMFPINYDGLSKVDSKV